jgi:hypothetical protein
MALADTLKFSEFMELLLARLYDMERSTRSMEYFDLNDAAQSLNVTVPKDWVFDAARVLEGRGLADTILTLGGGAHARLSGEGRLFVEEQRGTGIITKYHENPTPYVVVAGNQNQVGVGGEQQVRQTTSIEKEREPAFELLDEIRRKIAQDRELGQQEKEDLLTDVESVRGQLKKREPNRTVLAALLQPLSTVSSVANLVASLIKLLNP